MRVEWTPLRWPAAWTDPAALSLVRGTAINYLLIDAAPEFEKVRSQARQDGFRLGDPAELPAGVRAVKGEWAGVRMQRGGDGASAGPTGVAWVDSNGWAVRLAAAMHPSDAIWVTASPSHKSVNSGDSYLVTFCDSAAHGGRWVIALDQPFAAGLAAGRTASLADWKKLCDAAALFGAHPDWTEYVPLSTLGVISDFTGEHEFFGGELLNLLARAGQHYRILPKDGLPLSALTGLRAVIYADAAPAAPAVRDQLLAFVQAGGMLITHPKWGGTAGSPIPAEDHPRFSMHAAGKGRIALAKELDPDPYLWANDAAVLISHRYDLVRFWNGGATGSFYTVSPDRKRAIVHLLFYSDQGPDAASVRVAGRYRNAQILSTTLPAAQSVKMISQKDAVEVHLPQVSQYVALELEA
uniref:Uncharacterized protein n=1 Tax=Solibacter usitatus (strain Ellin6076) TaxID=234267 RepID=Q01ZG0_SOLUE